MTEELIKVMDGDKTSKLIELIEKLPREEQIKAIDKIWVISGMPPKYLLNDVTWFARASVSEAKKYLKAENFAEYIQRTRFNINNDDINNIPYYPMDEIIDVKFDFIIIEYQSDRYSEVNYIRRKYKAKNLSEHLKKYQFTVGDILEHVYKFYSGVMTDEHKNLVKDLDDGWGYSDIVKESLEKGTTIYVQQIMGDCMHFEGLRFITIKGEIPVYRIMLGS